MSHTTSVLELGPGKTGSVLLLQISSFTSRKKTISLELANSYPFFIMFMRRRTAVNQSASQHLPYARTLLCLMSLTAMKSGLVAFRSSSPTISSSSTLLRYQLFHKFLLFQQLHLVFLILRRFCL